jgi:hypothetical protein
MARSQTACTHMGQQNEACTAGPADGCRQTDRQTERQMHAGMRTVAELRTQTEAVNQRGIVDGHGQAAGGCTRRCRAASRWAVAGGGWGGNGQIDRVAWPNRARRAGGQSEVGISQTKGLGQHGWTDEHRAGITGSFCTLAL